MADFSKLIVTNKGKELIAKALANAAVITFTKVSSSGTAYNENELEILTDLEDIRQTSLISDVSLTSNTSVEIQASFTNMELTEGYYLRALGLFAEDPDVGEILYGVTSETSGNCYIPAYNGVTSSGIYLQFVTAVGNAENVSLEINPAAIATIKDIQKIEEKLKILDFDDSGEVEGITSFTDFLESFVKGTNIYQFFANFKTGLKYVLHTGKLVNSGMCETPGEFALDAAYGKVLQDQITGLYSEIHAFPEPYIDRDCVFTCNASGGTSKGTASETEYFSISSALKITIKRKFLLYISVYSNYAKNTGAGLWENIDAGESILINGITVTSSTKTSDILISVNPDDVITFKCYSNSNTSTNDAILYMLPLFCTNRN